MMRIRRAFGLTSVPWRKKIIVAEMNKEKEKAAPTQPSLPTKSPVLFPQIGAVAVTGTV